MRVTLFPVRVISFCKLLLIFLHCLVSKNSFSQLTRDTNKTITVAIAPGYDSVGSFHRFWLGNGYRKIWAAPFSTKVFRLNEEKGGLTPQEMGGGFQTKSLRLKDAGGRQWVLRSVQKYPERRLPQNLRNTIAQRILQDQVVTVHPFGALTVPPLAKALGLTHTNPQMVYISDDPALGKFRQEFANGVFLFEERGAIDTFRTISTANLQKELEEEGSVRVVQTMVLRARLLDFLLGDWDRHEGQWRWEAKGQKGETVYYPVPHDRDYVYYNTSGILPWLVARQWQMSRFQGFRNEIRNVDIYNFNNRYFDRYFLQSLDADAWKEQVGFVQNKITDDVIRQAIRRMPDTIYSLTGEHLIRTLLSRRNNLMNTALAYYHSLSEIVDVPATDKDEYFEMVHKPGGKIAVAVSKMAGSQRTEKILFNRELDPAVTKEIRLYGLGGNDRFFITGKESSPIKIRLIGGNGRDEFDVSSENPNKRNIYVYDRSDQENHYTSNALLRASTDSTVNLFDRRNFKYNRSIPMLYLFYNVDQRTFTSLGWVFQKHGFRKEPYASRHELVAGYAAVRGSFAFAYQADWRQVFGKF